jgi:uncharacterized protein YjbI with pentapeptide repeats
MATWWQTHRGELAKDLIIGVVVGGFLLLGGMMWDARLADRQNDLEKSIANGQDDLARNLANQAEVLENTRFVRQIATSLGKKTPKPFENINLSGAELAGLFLPCADVRHRVGCASFARADLHEANLRDTNLKGADFRDADLHNANLTDASLDRAALPHANLSGIATGRGPYPRSSAIFRNAYLGAATLVHAQLDRSDFTEAWLAGADASEAALSHGNFRHANLTRARFKHADLKNAKFRGAEMIRVDLTSADLRGADFTRADLRKAVFTDVCFDDTTKWGTNSAPTNSSC